MNTLRYVKSLILTFLLLISSYSYARQYIEVSAFYYPPSDMMKINNPTKDYTINQIQLRIMHSFDREVNMADVTFPLIGNGLAAMAPDDFIFSNMRIKDKTGWQPACHSDFGQDENRNRTFNKITYSYSPGYDGSFGTNLLCNSNHCAPALYTQSDKGNWYLISKKAKDTIDIFFNIDPSAFYIRTNRPTMTDDMGKQHMTVYPQEECADFYLFYMPAYKHITEHVDGSDIDFLFENIDDSKCKMTDNYYNVEYYPTDSIANAKFGYLKEIVSNIKKTVGCESLPKRLNVVLSSQVINMVGGNATDNSVAFSMAKQDKETDYGILLVDHSMFSTQTLIHELLHICFPNPKHNSRPEHNTSLFYNIFLKESVTEYIASYIYNNITDTFDVFSEHEDIVKKYYISDKQIKNIIKKESDNYVGEDKQNSTFWIYYNLLPLRLHKYSSDKHCEDDFCKALIEYIKNTRTEECSRESFSSYFKTKGYKWINNIFNGL